MALAIRNRENRCMLAAQIPLFSHTISDPREWQEIVVGGSPFSDNVIKIIVQRPIF